MYIHVLIKKITCNIIKGISNKKLGKVLLKTVAYFIFDSIQGCYLSFQLPFQTNSNV